MKELTKEEMLERELWIKAYVALVGSGVDSIYAESKANDSVCQFIDFFEDDEQ